MIIILLVFEVNKGYNLFKGFEGGRVVNNKWIKRGRSKVSVWFFIMS